MAASPSFGAPRNRRTGERRTGGRTADAKGAHIMAPLHTHTLKLAERREGAEEEEKEEDVTY